MEIKVLTLEEIKQLKDIQKKSFEISMSFGEIEIQIQRILSKKEELKIELNKIISEEQILGQQLQQKYGDGKIDLEKGEFISI